MIALARGCCLRSRRSRSESRRSAAGPAGARDRGRQGVAAGRSFQVTAPALPVKSAACGASPGGTGRTERPTGRLRSPGGCSQLCGVDGVLGPEPASGAVTARAMACGSGRSGEKYCAAATAVARGETVAPLCADARATRSTFSCSGRVSIMARFFLSGTAAWWGEMKIHAYRCKRDLPGECDSDRGALSQHVLD